VICTGLALAGVPAVACCAADAPLKDCCPQRQQIPRQDSQISALAPTSGTETCCAAAGAADTATLAAKATTPDVRKHPQRTDPLALIVSFALWATACALPPSRIGFTPAAYLPSYTTLYLSSGRLRL
jgi:hypothetical protein